MPAGASRKADLAIIGAGVAGCYGAYRLSQTFPEKNIHVYEASNRIGGRLRSQALAGSGLEGVIELGGMFLADAHENVFGLVQRLGLPTTSVNFRRQRYYLRGRLLDDAMFSARRAIPYHLRADEEGKSPSELALHALKRIVPHLPELWPFALSGPLATPEAAAHYLRELRVHGRPLCDWNLANLLDLTISSEACVLLAATMGSSASLRGNALDSITTLLWEANPRQRYFMLTGGYQQLPSALQRACGSGVAFFPERRLTRIATLPNGFTLEFETPHGERTSVDAAAVILTMPKHALELVKFEGVLISDQFHRDVNSVSTVPACKLFLGFENAWWSETCRHSISAGDIAACCSDLPMQQTWYFKPPAAKLSLVLAAFADEADAAFWSDLTSPAYRDRRPRPWLEGDDDTLRASEGMIETARRHLQLLHPNAAVPDPAAAVFVDWGADPHRGAWHVWKPYVRSWQVRRRMRQPNHGIPLFICSDAFAHVSGWVEATINSMEALIEEHFYAPRPDWVRGSYDFDF